MLLSAEAVPRITVVNNSEYINIKNIHSMIRTLQPSISDDVASKMAGILSASSIKHKLDPRILVAIIDVESQFKHSKVSYTGDYSIVQINVKTWSKEFARNGKKLDVNKLKKSERYAVEIMTDILTIIKKKHSSNDRKWYARYHSSTPEFKNAYFLKIQSRVKKL